MSLTRLLVGLCLVLVTLLALVRTAAAAELDGVRYDFARNYISLSFEGAALEGTLGSKTSDGRYYPPSNKFGIGCVASTPAIALAAGSIVDVEYVYKANWQFWALPREAATEALFMLIAGPDGPDGLQSWVKREIVRVIHLGKPREIVSPAQSDAQGWYEVESPYFRMATLANLTFPEATSEFTANLCHVGIGADVLVHRISLRIKPGIDPSRFPAPTTEVNGFKNTESLLACSSSGLISTGCSVAPRLLVDSQREESDFWIQYEYECPGSPLDIVVRTDISEKTLESGPGTQEMHIVGTDYLRLRARDPAYTLAAYVEPGCHLNINDIKIRPSSATLALWAQEGRSLAAALRDRLDLVRLMRTLSRIIEWDTQQILMIRPDLENIVEGYLIEHDASWADCGSLTSLLEGNPPSCSGWTAAMASHPEMVSLVLLLSHTQAAIDGRPLVAQPHVVSVAARESEATLTEYYSAALHAKMTEATEFRKRLQDARESAHKDLEAALADVLANTGASGRPIARNPQEPGEER